MQIIPVIDLLGAQVVRAVRGDRQHYRAIVSPLCRSADPVEVAERLSEHCATDTLYVADLNALQGRAAQVEVLAALLRAAPRRRLWVDAGYADRAGVRALRQALAARGADASRLTPVLASESLRSADALAQCLEDDPEAMLSLDRRHGLALDAAGLWRRPTAWPQRLIVMALDRVGSGEGPDLTALAEVRAQAPLATLIGAGGVRNESDLRRAAEAGATAWLVASALHDGGLAARPFDTPCGAAVSESPRSAAANGDAEAG